ncbi:hypothetical protein KP509_11G035900 [Ceratopteris richardii]|uniref:EXS domain-containing protein n=1 Tax=Ceratopteris richardii TaxID=49495 RepID=A0A8T2TQG2_CERRI|nr:hypothetical protein KP509_11G035900 [Ceratopteris richardii]
MFGTSLQQASKHMQVLVVLLWISVCCKAAADSVMRTTAETRSHLLYETFLYYNPLLLVAGMLWLWGINLRVFSAFKVNYAKVFDLDGTHLMWKGIWMIALWITLGVLTNILTSMAKVLSDLERAACRTFHGQVATLSWFEPHSTCGSHSIWIPCALALPYVFRFFQCLRQYSDTRDNTCILNALKYASSLPVILLSALKYHVTLDLWRGLYRPLWLLSRMMQKQFLISWAPG